jgi:hypothetical protein
MNDCDNAEVRDLLPDLVHGSLGAARRSGVEDHVRGCAACQRELDLLRAAQVLLARTPTVDIGRIVSALPKPPESGSQTGVPSSWAHAGAWRRAAAITIAVTAGAAMGVGTRDWWTRQSTRSSFAQTGAPAGDSAPAAVAVPQPPARRGDAAELVLAAGVQELDDAQLDALLREIEALDAVPSEEPLSVLPAFAAESGEGGV